MVLTRTPYDEASTLVICCHVVPVKSSFHTVTLLSALATARSRPVTLQLRRHTGTGKWGSSAVTRHSPPTGRQNTTRPLFSPLFAVARTSDSAAPPTSVATPAGHHATSRTHADTFPSGGKAASSAHCPPPLFLQMYVLPSQPPAAIRSSSAVLTHGAQDTDVCPVAQPPLRASSSHPLSSRCVSTCTDPSEDAVAS